jgi:hypothetical protein
MHLGAEVCLEWARALLPRYKAPVCNPTDAQNPKDSQTYLKIQE